MFNFSAGIKDRDGRYTAEVFVNNAFDKQFYSGLGQDLLYGPVALVGGYARDTFRYWGGRLSIRY